MDHYLTRRILFFQFSGYFPVSSDFCFFCRYITAGNVAGACGIGLRHAVVPTAPEASVPAVSLQGVARPPLPEDSGKNAAAHRRQNPLRKRPSGGRRSCQELPLPPQDAHILRLRGLTVLPIVLPTLHLLRI